VKRVDKNELDDLQTSDVLLPPDLLLQAGQEVVVIPVCTDVVNVVYGMTSPWGVAAQHGDKRDERRAVVHEDVDEAVEQLSAPLDGDEVLEAVPHEEHRHPMVVHMKERELVLHTSTFV
jgi:hypothetical protein